MEIVWFLLSVERNNRNKQDEEDAFHAFATGNSCQFVV